jgi:2-dehydro-3-deoxyphosphogluconate aldolase/(4S)-4-hydroxy-2-oxoglutarate aldolase
MHKKEKVLEALLSQKLLPLYYHDDPVTGQRILESLYAAGLRVVEYTNRGEEALRNYRELKQYAEKKFDGLFLGIGTIKTRKSAKKFIEAGADFIVAPTINEEVGELASAHHLLWIPGCLTPTEISRAEEAGASLVKIFPGNILGPGYVSAIRELFPGVRFMPTGGVEVNEENLSAWFRSGVVAVGMGSRLIPKDPLEKGYDQLVKDAGWALQLVQQVAAAK